MGGRKRSGKIRVNARDTPDGEARVKEAPPADERRGGVGAEGKGVSILDRAAARRSVTLPHLLPGGVMVAQATLTRLVMVRTHAGQPVK